MSKEEQIERNVYEEEEKKRQSFYASYCEDDVNKVTPHHLRLIHRRNNLTMTEKREIDALFEHLYKNRDCLEEERFFLQRDKAGKFIWKPDVYDMSTICPFKKKHEEYSYMQRKNPKSR